jgi:hypothetical protein
MQPDKTGFAPYGVKYSGLTIVTPHIVDKAFNFW